jgi:asparagine synthase (glutamine-hydrolysing)
MFRYIIMAWNANRAPDCEAAGRILTRMQSFSTSWRCALHRPGMYVAHVNPVPSAYAAIPIGDSRGVILGTLFRTPASSDSSQPNAIRCLSPGHSEEILRSAGRTLIADYWGYYVAAMHYPERASAVVVRSPVSPLACFHVEKGSFNVFFSHLDDCIDCNVTPISINWDCVIAQVMAGDHLTRETGIKEIDSLECGESVECKPDGHSRHAYWDPRSFLGERTPAHFEQAARAIRTATEYCVNAHSSPHDGILINLSGGLDSSIVLSSLSRASHGPSTTAVTYFSAGSGDERRFARGMAATVDCRLIERPRNRELNFRRFLECNRTVRPVLNFSAPDVESRNNDLARDLNATAIFDGELGDNIFGSNPKLGVLVECCRLYGLGSQFLKVAVDYAMLSRRSVWRTLALARQEALSVSRDPNFSASQEIRRSLGAERARSAMLATPEAEEHHRAMEDRFIHPWFKESRRIAPGSLGLLFGLINVTSPAFHSPFSGPDDPLRVSPLVSQPLLEIILRVPRHLHFRHAQDRAVARAAFADVLPLEILGRGLGKGGPDLWAKEVIENNVVFLREFLLDGVLVSRRLIDRKKLETVLSAKIAKSTVFVGEIFAKTYIEAWIRKLQQVESRSA